MFNPSVAEANALWKKTWPRIVARAWSDQHFMERLKKDPQGVAREYNLPLVENVAYVVEADAGSDPHKMVLHLPPKPKDLPADNVEELSRYADEQKCADSSCV